MATFAALVVASHPTEWNIIERGGDVRLGLGSNARGGTSGEVRKGCGKKAGRMALRGRQIRWPALRLGRRVGRVRFEKGKSSEHGGFRMVEFGATDRPCLGVLVQGARDNRGKDRVEGMNVVGRIMRNTVRRSNIRYRRISSCGDSRTTPNSSNGLNGVKLGQINKIL
ncbi:hypothetical protein M5K25_028380 [Dendrobium thyrsiflorum]|uniref:Uncharacterized protein n=1 Tax=Dendrobium thyrsiflorum TaxID=117978 RepID=A0ABD0TTF0_DENTH